MRADLRIFRERINRLIIVEDGKSPLSPPPILNQDSRQFVNGPTVVIDGVEVETQWQPSRNLRVGLTYASLSIDSPLIQARRSAPTESASISLAWSPGPGWGVDLAHHRASDMSWFSARDSRRLGKSRRTDLR
ncbi:hypothetical protein V6O07_12130, partial [Arthrospira platensis SPKY2]